eukprot:928567-Prymnesium_polylepis.1
MAQKAPQVGDRVQIVNYDATPCVGRIGTLVEADKVLFDKGDFSFVRREEIVLVSKPLSTDAPGGGPNGIVAIGAEDGSGEEGVRRMNEIVLVSKPLSTDAPGGGPNGIVAIGAEDGSGEEEVRMKEKRKWKEVMAIEKQNK